MGSLNFETGMAVAFGASIVVLYEEPIRYFIKILQRRFNALNNRKFPI
jgi:hypothetical protein